MSFNILLESFFLSLAIELTIGCELFPAGIGSSKQSQDFLSVCRGRSSACNSFFIKLKFKLYKILY